ncbi:succinyldiaminopimelate transaminase [Candidatus Marithrix sp. Canyon 246]|uniref:succinyldiaminopimelate transaminase n=1 Tax=Candidatus Marithrix sp. Canyon 246 TaxID=1827136 RepID=UPI00084A1636|nr:succinyldiaminopimelate transaminase [Candidatus Marithrix sp. Canyon 246]
MNPNLNLLEAYPFEKLNNLFNNVVPPTNLSSIKLSIGEPQHATPDIIIQAMAKDLNKNLAKYPTTKGSLTLRESIAYWLSRRFNLENIDPNSHILPVNGTREALFAFAQTVVNSQTSNPLVLMPNPFYQIYEGAAKLAGATPWFINSFDDSIASNIWQQCQLLYICSPSNPSGNILDISILKKLIEYSDKYNFIIAADECYSEIYADEAKPPIGLLEACHLLNRPDYKNCVVFHSLSKRSNAPGLRSGFIAGDANIISKYLKYRTYHGCAMSLATQNASIAAWQDETHVIENRILYRQKFAAVIDILKPVLPFLQHPPGGFYLWAKTPINDQTFALELLSQQNVTVLPGSFLSRVANDVNPGENYVRMALVASLDECIEAANRIYTFIKNN